MGRRPWNAAGRSSFSQLRAVSEKERRGGASRPSVSAVILAHRRMRELEVVLERLAKLPVDEVLVAGDGSGDAVDVVVRHGDRVRLIEPTRGEQNGGRPRFLAAEFGPNWGIAGRNAAAREAKGDFLLFLDDDSYPLPGSIEKILAAFEHQPRLGVVGGLVREIDWNGQTISECEPGSFDWLLRAGARGEPPPEGFPSFFFPEGACMIRRDAFLAVGGFFEPYFFTVSELDLATRMIAEDWDVGYLPIAPFHHLRDRPHETKEQERDPYASATALSGARLTLRLRVRNQLWYFWMRFPPLLAARRIPAYLAFDLLDCAYRGAPSAWWAGIQDAWRERDRVRGARNPLAREVIRRAELNRGRMHLRLLAAALSARLPGAHARLRRD